MHSHLKNMVLSGCGKRTFALCVTMFWVVVLGFMSNAVETLAVALRMNRNIIEGEEGMDDKLQPFFLPENFNKLEIKLSFLTTSFLFDLNRSTWS